MTKAKTGWLLPGILCLASLVVAQDTAWKKYMDAAKVAFDRDRYAEAEKQLLTALKEAEKFREQDRRLAVNLGALGTVYRAQGRYAEAEPLLWRALAVAEKAMPPEHPDVTSSLDNLAALYTAQGRYAEAEPLLRRVLAIDEKEAEKFGEDPQLAISLNAMGTVYRAQGRYAEAEPLLRRALAIVEKRVAEKELEPEDPRVVEVVAPILDNLAALYTAQAKYAEAEPLFRRALAIREKTLGPERPEVAKTLDNYAELLRKTNREAEAAKLEARAKAIRAKHAGKNPPK